ncbi:protein FAR-RED ELONGATED HYPOCOTYL 3-like isoform X2 [Ananas comosus]|uniref:Protein FAR1-RELATED SEQUENCE n=1 Tax=Ananas comosus TaxID=4615 RepID=A0A6P5EEN8_ANACO|nr:protein FAR-RED ELONGATED HYPOCOTYL 3-like isoform X2 [Ananas comosus]
MKSVMMDAIYESLTEIEFEEKWKRMIACYALENNQWLSGLYEERHKWIPAYVKDTFWAGMSTTQRSESMNAFFDGYVNSKTSLKQFVEQYESAIKNKAEKEAELDYKSFSSVIPCISRYAFEKQFQDVYTITKFREFQAELKELLHCETSLLSSTGSVYSYQVNEYGDGGKDVPFTVYFDEGTSLVSCICRLFEYKGILCRHSIAVLVHRKLMIVPNSYILTRWRKDVRRRYTRVKTWHKNLGSTAEIYRYEEVCRNMYDIADIAAESDEKCELALRTLRDLKTKLENTSSSKGSNDIEYSPIAATPSNDASNGRSNDQRVLSPLPVRSKGRPPSKRKESTTDKVVRRLKMKGNKEQVGQHFWDRLFNGECSIYNCVSSSQSASSQQSVHLQSPTINNPSASDLPYGMGVQSSRDIIVTTTWGPKNISVSSHPIMYPYRVDMPPQSTNQNLTPRTLMPHPTHLQEEKEIPQEHELQHGERASPT